MDLFVVVLQVLDKFITQSNLIGFDTLAFGSLEQTMNPIEPDG